jgi:hypothetical protein
VKIVCVHPKTDANFDHFELVLKVVSIPKDGDGYLGLVPEGSRSWRIRTAEFSKTGAGTAGA